MTKEPGLSSLAEFAIDTSDSRPIAQRPYSLIVVIQVLCSCQWVELIIYIYFVTLLEVQLIQ